MSAITTTTLFEISTPQFAASVERHEITDLSEDDEFQLIWWDYVANEWTETYQSPDQAVARLALLLRVVDNDEMFRLGSTPEAFSEAWDTFTEEHTE